MKKLFYFFIGLFLASCTSNTIYKKPENLIPRDTMVALLTDMYIASSAKKSKNKQFKRDINYLPLVYNKYNIDSTRFSESNVYYMSVIETYHEILLEVKDSLKKHQEKYAKQVRLRDSLNRAKNKTISKQQLEINPPSKKTKVGKRILKGEKKQKGALEEITEDQEKLLKKRQ